MKLENLSMQLKIIFSIVFLTIAVSVLSIAVFVSNDLTQYHKLTSLFNEIINYSSSLSSAVINNNVDSINENLSNLKLNLDISTIELYSYDGKTLTKYSSDNSSKNGVGSNNLEKPEKSLFSFFDKKLDIVIPIIKKGKSIGAIHVQSNNYNYFIYSIIETITLITLIAIFVAAYLSGIITKSYSILVAAMNDVSGNNLSVRIKKTSNGEVGRLIDAFNLMLEKIETYTKQQEIFKEHTTQLATAMSLVIENNDYSIRLNKIGEDQVVGVISESFNTMLEKIQIYHKELIKISRMAGMAEVSTSILHNIGNVLNSVNVTTQLLMERIKILNIENLVLLAELLKSHTSELGPFFTENPKGKTVIEYLAAFAENLKEEQKELLMDAGTLIQHIEHIKSIVASQQSMCKSRSIIEQVPITELMENVLAIVNDLVVSNNILIKNSNTITSPASIDRSKVEQILVNLLRNSIDSLMKCNHEDKQIVINSFLDDKNEKIIMQVSDNGKGITKENLVKIFNFGYTTKEDGHGFGLHISILAAQEMRGTLEATSAGLNQGATFKLILPAST